MAEQIERNKVVLAQPAWLALVTRVSTTIPPLRDYYCVCLGMIIFLVREGSARTW